MTSSAAEMSDTSPSVPMSREAIRIGRLCRMLRSTLQSFPNARVHRGREGFGASLGDGTWIWIRSSGHLSGGQLRDLLALFATWCAVDAGFLLYAQDAASDGVSLTAAEASLQSNMRGVSNGSH
jgi:hypothetical protein